MRETPATSVRGPPMENPVRRQDQAAIRRGVLLERRGCNIAREKLPERGELIAREIVLILEFGIDPPVCRQSDGGIGVGTGRLRFDLRQRAIGGTRLQAVNTSLQTRG